MIAMACGRKIQILSMIHDLEFRLQLLNQKRMNLSSTAMVVGDGNITMNEIQSSNFHVQNGIAGVLGMANMMTAQTGGQMQMAYRNPFNPSTITIHAAAQQQAQYQLAAQEKQLDMQAKQIETKLSMYQREYEAVQKQEEFAVKIGTPKYVA